MRIAICGIRGIPACYGGFETFAEELSTRLVQRGHEVIVYGRSHVIGFKGPEYRGVKIKLLWAPRHKYLETPIHTLLCYLDLLFQKNDVLLVCNAANGPFTWIPRLKFLPVVINLDGIERHRAKWNIFGKLWYVLGEITSRWFASKLIADAQVIHDYYKKTYNTETVVIPYGHIKDSEEYLTSKLAGLPLTYKLNEHEQSFKSLGVTSDKYILYVSRLEPENNAHVVIEAFSLLPQELKNNYHLLIVGDAPYAKDYIAKLKSYECPNVIFAGYRFGEDYKMLQRGAYLYIQATEVGGTHPALVEAMGFGNCVIANSTPENTEVLDVTGCYYELNNPRDLKNKLQELLNSKNVVLDYRRRAQARAVLIYDWEKISSSYEDLFKQLVARD